MTGEHVIEGFTIFNACILVVQSIRVIAVYSAYYSLMEKGVKRQLPLHVWLIATSYLIYVLSTTMYLLLFDKYSLSRAIVYGVAGLIGQFALWNVLSYERRQYSVVSLED